MTDTATLPLTDFLLARYAEQEDPIRYYQELEARYPTPHLRGWKWVQLYGVNGPSSRFVDGVPTPEQVLADIEAKRRIVELHTHPAMACYWSHDGGAVHEIGELCETLAALALPYVDHPDYREEWRP